VSTLPEDAAAVRSTERPGAGLRKITAAELKRWLGDGRELALLDLREELIFSRSEQHSDIPKAMADSLGNAPPPAHRARRLPGRLTRTLEHVPAKCARFADKDCR
jgi:hypothetical protein